MSFAAQDYYLVKVWRIMDHGNFADMPSADSPDRLWWASDKKVLYRDTGSAWHRISSFDGHAYGDVVANRPAVGVADRLFFATDELILYRDTGLAWEAIGVGGDHHSRHENAGADEISVAGLSGELADRQPVKLHAIQHVTAGDDVIANAVAAGNAGLMTGADKTKMDGIGSGANAVVDVNIGDNTLVRGADGAKKIQGCSTTYVHPNNEITNSAQPCFSVTPNTSQGNIAINTITKILFQTELYDIGNNFADSIFTAPVTAKFFLTGLIELMDIDIGADYYEVQIRSSNYDFKVRLHPQFSADVAYYPMIISFLVEMDINDTAYIAFYQFNGAQQTDIYAESFFSGFLVA